MLDPLYYYTQQTSSNYQENPGEFDVAGFLTQVCLWCGVLTTCLCTKNGNKIVFGCLLRVWLKCTMPLLASEVCLHCGVSNVPTAAPIMPSKVSSDTQYRWVSSAQCHLFTSYVCFRCGAPNVHTAARLPNKSVFGYLVWVCLKCGVPFLWHLRN